MRPHLANLVEDFRAHQQQTAVVLHRGVRSYRTTYGDLAELAGRFAADLDRRGIAAGERVVLWGENSAEWIAAFFGCLLRGVLAVPLDAAGSVSFANRVITEVTPKLIVGDTLLLATLPAGIDRLAFADMAAHLPAEPDFRVSESVREDAPFQIVFTSGTTAEPKGVVHTHRNVLASLRPIEAEIAKYLRYERVFHPLRFLHTLPLSHVFGQFMGLWLPASLAAELHFTDALEPARAVELIRRERTSVLVAVPRPLIWLLAAPRLRSPQRQLPTGPLLLIANHVTAFDGALVLYALPPHLRRNLAIAMSGEMLSDLRRARGQATLLQNLLAPAAYYLLTALFNVFPLPRVSGFRRSFTHAGEAMDRGLSVLIFPEGTRSRDGTLQPFRQGIGLLAAQSRVPVLPVALMGLGELRSSGKWFRSGRLKIRMGGPVFMPEHTRTAEWTSRLQSAVGGLLAKEP